MGELNVLSVAPYVPYEGILHAGGEYLLRHLHGLSRSARVTLLVPGSDEAVADARRAPDWLELVVAPIDEAARSRSRVLRDAAYRRLMAAPPMPTAESLRAVRAGGLVERAAAADVVELHWPEYARFARELRDAGVRTPVSVIEHDVDVRGAVRRLRTRVRGYRMVLGVLTSPLSRRWELEGLRSADLVCVFKAADEQLLRGLGVETPVRVLAPWVEAPPREGPDRQPATVLFTGAMWRPENDAGARWLVDEVWPRVQSAVPEATLVIAGAGPSHELRASAAARSVSVTGELPSLLPSYQSAGVFVAPLFSGGGLKFKVAQAMTCGLPVVGTSVALEGVADAAPAGTIWGVADTASSMADLLVRALQQPDAAAAVGAAGALWAEEHWSFRRSIDAVAADYRALAGRAPEPTG